MTEHELKGIVGSPLDDALGFSFSGIEDGYVGYQEPHTQLDTPLKDWLAARGLIDIPMMTEEP